MESFQYNAVYTIANIILYMMMLGAVQLNCERRWSLPKTLLVEAATSVLYMFIATSLPIFTPLRTLTGFAFIIVMGELFHRGSWQRKFFVTGASILAMFLSEILFMTIMPREASVTGELMQTYPVAVYSLYLFVNLVVISVTALLIRTLSRRLNGQALERQWLVLMAFPVSQCIALFAFFYNYMDLALPHHSVNLIVTVAVFVLADVALVQSLRVSERNAAMRARNEILEEQIGAQKHYYAQLTESYENIRKMRHDIDNHLYTMQALLKEGQVEEAASYAGELIETDTARIHFPGCANHVIASFLEKKSEDYQEAGVTLDAEVSLPVETGISNPDMICALGNILDNALEAGRGMADPHVMLKAGYKKPYVSISCRNPVKRPLANASVKQKKIPELERGIGLTILQDLAEKYDGQLEAEAVPGEGSFKTTLILKEAMRE